MLGLKSNHVSKRGPRTYQGLSMNLCVDGINRTKPQEIPFPYGRISGQATGKTNDHFFFQNAGANVTMPTLKLYLARNYHVANCFLAWFFFTQLKINVVFTLYQR